MSKLNWVTKACGVFLLWAVAAAGLPAQVFTTVHSFDLTDGYEPSGPLVQGTDGNFYGMTYYGGAYTNCNNGCGTVFKITPGGTLTTIHSFDWTDGAAPSGGLIQGRMETSTG